MQPIRIQAIYTASDGGSDIATEAGMSSGRKAVVATAVSAALARFSQLLLVRPVSGPLFAYRPCTNQWANGRCAAVSTSPTCFLGSDDVPVSLSALLGSQVIYPVSPSSAQTLPAAGPGLSSTDTAIFVTAKQTADCGSGTIAYASYCQRASDDRPTLGRVNFCPDKVPPSVTDAGYEDFLSTVLHELTHVLVFSSSLFPYFRDDAGVARTPRDSWGDPTTAFFSFPRNAYVASGITISYASERGMDCSWGAATSWATANIPFGLDSSLEPSNCVARLSTQRVKAATRAFFSCDTLEGAELENQDTSTGFVQGSHWEARTLAGEYMAAYSSPGSKISAITLAVFEDSGWYSAVYANSDAWIAGSDWGFKQGCAFAGSKCSSTNTGSPPHFYFGAPDISGSLCSVDRSTPAFTATKTYTSPLPAHYQYFSSPNIGGSAERYDYCPAIRPYTAPSTVCKTTSASVAYGETVGAGSKCHVSTLNSGSASPSSGYGSCYRVTCAGSGLSYTITVGTGATATCTTEGAVVTFSGYSGSVVCGSPTALCSAGEVWVPPCPVGYGVSAASAACAVCAAGLFSAGGTGAACSQCASNTYSGEGAQSCTACAAGLVSPPGAAACAPPPSLAPPTPSPTPTGTQSGTPTQTASATASETARPTVSPSSTGTSTGTGSSTVSGSPTPTVSPTPSLGASASASPSAPETPSGTGSSTTSVSGTGTSTSSGTGSATATSTDSASGTDTGTASPTSTVTGSSTVSVTPTGTGSPTASLTVGASPSSTSTVSLSVSFTATGSPSATPSGSGTGTATLTPTSTSSVTPSATQTLSCTGAATPTHTTTRTSTSSPSLGATLSITPTNTLTPSRTTTGTPSSTATPSGAATATPSVTPPLTLGASASNTASSSPSRTGTASLTPTGTRTGTGTRTPTATLTLGVSPSTTPSTSVYPSDSASNRRSPTNTPTPSVTPLASGLTLSGSPSLSSTPSAITAPLLALTLQLSLPRLLSEPVALHFLQLFVAALELPGGPALQRVDYVPAGVDGFTYSFTALAVLGSGSGGSWSLRRLALTSVGAGSSLLGRVVSDGSLREMVAEAGIAGAMGYSSTDLLFAALSTVDPTIVLPPSRAAVASTLAGSSISPPDPSSSASASSRPAAPASSGDSSTVNLVAAIGGGLGAGIVFFGALVCVYRLKLLHGPSLQGAASKYDASADPEGAAVKGRDFGSVALRTAGVGMQLEAAETVQAGALTAQLSSAFTAAKGAAQTSTAAAALRDSLHRLHAFALSSPACNSAATAAGAQAVLQSVRSYYAEAGSGSSSRAVIPPVPRSPANRLEEYRLRVVAQRSAVASHSTPSADTVSRRTQAGDGVSELQRVFARREAAAGALEAGSALTGRQWVN